MIRLEHLSKNFGKIEVLRDVSLKVSHGEVVGVLGPSGAGKSTLLRCVNFLESPTSGTITMGNLTIDCAHAGKEDIRFLRSKTGMVFQQHNLFKNMTALENVSAGLTEVRMLPRKEALEAAREYLARVGLSDREDFYPGKLSGGQQQRVSIARALAMEPELLLLDEPTSALDPELTREVLRTIKKLASEGNTMLIVTHETTFARDVADRLVFMEDGRIVEEGESHQLYFHPTKDRTQAFMQSAREPLSYEI
jgi:L-cystine transport system ATP-binding protein